MDLEAFNEKLAVHWHLPQPKDAKHNARGAKRNLIMTPISYGKDQSVFLFMINITSDPSF
jgi:hypothetical protein